MLKKIIALYFLLIAFNGNSQTSNLALLPGFNYSISSMGQTPIDKPAQKEYYLARSKKFNTIGIIFLGVGITSVIVPLALPESNKGSIGVDVTKLYFVCGGALASLVSIPYFISAHNNKKKGMELAVLPNVSNGNGGWCVNLKIKL